MATGENSSFRSLVLSIPGHQAKSTLCAFVWKQLGGEELYVWYYRKLSWCACGGARLLGNELEFRVTVFCFTVFLALDALAAFCRYYQGTVLVIRCEHAMKSGQVNSGLRHQRQQLPVGAIMAVLGCRYFRRFNDRKQTSVRKFCMFAIGLGHFSQRAENLLFGRDLKGED
jgi:hypothetical protein